VHLSIIKRRERCDDCNAKSFLARNQVMSQNAPGAMPITDAHDTGKSVDRIGELDSAVQDLMRECTRDFDRSRPAEVAVLAVGDVGPAFQKNTRRGSFRIKSSARDGGLVDEVETAFEADEIVPAALFPMVETEERFRAQAGAAHQFFACRGRVGDAAWNLGADNLTLCPGRQERRKGFCG